MTNFIYIILDGILGFMLFSLVAYVIMSWLVGFRVLNPRSPIVYQIERVLDIIVNPMLEPFRRLLPNLGGLDLSPFLAGLLISAVRQALLPKAMIALQQLIG